MGITTTVSKDEASDFDIGEIFRVENLPFNLRVKGKEWYGSDRKIKFEVTFDEPERPDTE